MPLSRSLAVVLAGLTLSGCVPAIPASTPAAPAPAVPATPEVQVQPLTADQLAQILGVNVWTAKYTGGPIECWLEIKEEGQSTMPRRIPEKDFLGAGSPGAPREGTIDLWWTRREDRQGGQLTIHAANGGYSYGLGKDAFTFVWPSFSARSTTAGKGDPIHAEEGKEFVIFDYEASESLPAGDKKPPRKVHLKLMGRFAEPEQTDEN
jgi:hypothetical protein